MSGFLVNPLGSNRRVRKLLHERLHRYAILQRHRDRRAEGIHQPADGAAFLGHRDEHFAGRAVIVQADRDVAFVPGDVELVRHRLARARASGGAAAASSIRCRPALRVPVSSLPSCRCVDGLAALAAVAVDGHRLEAELPASVMYVSMISSGVDSCGMFTVLVIAPDEERLGRRHHLDVRHVLRCAAAVARP